ncbi:MAG: hypothetical protein ABJN84_16620, partial [Flavobacteriaceae bacterium]
MKFSVLTFLLCVLLSCVTETKKEENYIYIDNQTDFDTYKKSDFAPGTHILFASGKSFNGQFAPTGSGTKEDPIKITAYDSKSKEIFWDDIDNKPIINGHG